ncbi:MAG: hypothetical protein WBH14_11560 [Albidovulum sp.]
MFAIIPRIDKVYYATLRSEPPTHLVSAVGTVPTTGWTDGSLVPYVYVTPPKDGIQDFAFEAALPDGIVIPVESTITANWEGLLPAWVVGVRVRGATNDIVEMFVENGGNAYVEFGLRGGEIPWPLAR